MKFKGLFLAALTSILLSFGFSNTAYASHAMGADIYYQCVGQDSFLVTVNFYRDCAGTTAPTTIIVNATSTSCGASQNITLTRPNNISPQGIANGSEVSALCNAKIDSSTCHSGGYLPGVQQYQYTGLFVPNAQCPDWVLSFSVYARNAAITTLQTPDFYDLYVEATLNNTGGICNNSPIFTNRPVPYFCFLDTIFYNHGTVDFDGDSLVYTLIQPLEASGSPIPYVTGFSVNNPLTTNGTFTFNSATGQLFFVPQQAEIGVITIRVDEYRNGVLVGSTMRDIQVVILGPPTCNPPYGVINNDGIDSASVTGGVYVSNFDLESCPGDTVGFDIMYVGDSIYLSSNASLALPGATFDTSQIASDTVIGHFSWVTTVNDTGFNVFSLSYGINSCPIDRTSSQSVLINVLDGTYALPKQSTFCSDGAPIPLEAYGGNSFTWSPGDGLSDSTISNPLASPTVTTSYIVESNLSSRCKNRDTVTVELVPNFILDIQPQLDTVDICRNSLTPLTVTTDSLWGPYNYTWSPGIGLSDSLVSDPYASPDVPTQYVVSVTSDTGCTLTDTIMVDVTGVGPQVFATAVPDQTCPGDTVQLSSAVYPISCGPSIGPGSCANNPTQILSYGSGTLNEAVTPFAGQSSDGRYQVLYRASLLQNANIPAGTIVRIQFNVGINASNTAYKDMKIRMGCTSETQLSRNDWLPTTTQVYSSSNFVVSGTGVIGFNLSQPYDWDGVSNLVIEFCYGDATFTNPGGNDLLVTSNAGYPAAMNATSSSANGGCSLPASDIPVNQPVLNVPNFTFFICAASTPNYTYEWSPAMGLSDNHSPNPTAVVNSNTTYTLVVSDTVCDGSDFATITIDTTSLTTSNDTILCNADSVQLFVNLNAGGLPVTCGLNGNSCNGPESQKIVGTGTVTNISSSWPTAYSNHYKGVRQQFLYTASELQAAGVQPGRITAMAFDIVTVQGPFTYPNYTIKMKCTSTTELTIGSFETGLVTVLNPQSISLVNSGWNNHVLNNAYDWDGTSNLVVEICTYNAAFFTLNTIVNSSSTTYQSSIYEAEDADLCNGATATHLGGANARPNIRLTTCPAPPPYTLSWSPGNTLTDSTILDPIAFPSTSTTYYVTVHTASGCTKVDSVYVGIGSLPYTLSNDTMVCRGENVQLLVSGADVYSWSPAAGLSCTNCANPVATPDSSTTYYVTIIDTTVGCTVMDSVTVGLYGTPRPPLDPVVCMPFGGQVVLDGGSGFSAYFWSPSGHGGRYDTVSQAGIYTLLATDLNGCSVMDTTEVVLPSLGPINLGNDTSLCAGDSLLLDAGQGWLSVLWSTGDTTQTITVDTTGTYYVVALDPSGCNVTDTIDVFFLPVPVVDLGNDTTICYYNSLTLIAGTLPGYSYLWNDSSTNSSLTLSAPGPDTAYVTVFGGSACFGTDTIVVNYYPEVVVDIGPDTNTCNGVAITFDAGPGFASYLWSTGDMTQTTTTATGGEVWVLVQDQMGCLGSDTANLIDISPQVSLGNDTIVCESDSIFLNAGAGFASYAWNTPTLTDTTVWISQTGDYAVTVTDTNNCVTVDSVYLQFNPFPTVDLGNDTIVCFGELVTFDAGNPGANYVWSDNSMNQTLTTGAPAEYSVVVSDSIGCSGTDTVLFSLYQTVPVDLGPDLAQCVSSDVFFLEATGPYQSYIWNDNSTADTLLVTAPGTYSVTVTDFNGCSSSDSVIVLPAPAVDAGNDVDICIGDSVQLNATGGTIFEWTPADGLSETQIANPIASPTVTTTYYVTGGNPTGNLVFNGDFEQGNTGFSSDYTYSPNDLFPEATYAVLADPNTAHSAFVGSDHTSGTGLFMACNGSGTLGDLVWCSTVQVIPNTNYNFSTWISSLVTNNPAQLQFTINGVPIGPTIIAPNAQNVWEQFFAIWNSGSNTTANICITNLNTATGGNDFGLDDIVFETICGGMDSVTVVVHDPPAVDLGADQTICPGTVTVLDAGAGLSIYDWSNNDSTRTSTVGTAGTFSVTVTDAFGCVNADTVDVALYPGVSFDLDSIELCPGETDTLYGPAGYVSYMWSDSSTGQNLAVSEAGQYYLTVMDSNGCFGTDTTLVADVGIDITLSTEPAEINIGESATLSVEVFNGSGMYTYNWTPDSLIAVASDSSQVVSPSADQMFYVTVTDEVTGCSESDSILVVVFDQTNFAFPQAFSPNGDGDNDVFEMLSTGDVVLRQFRIYDQWGELIHDKPTGWDGTRNGVDQPIGTYVYTAVIDITTASGTTTENVQGVFTLLR